MPQPSKLTPEVRDRIAAVIRAGGSTELAAVVVGITERTYFSWMQRGTRPGRREAPYRELRAAVERARAEQEITLILQMQKAAAKGSWRAAAWQLERLYPERWAPLADRPRAPVPGALVDALDALDEPTPRRGRPGLQG